MRFGLASLGLLGLTLATLACGVAVPAAPTLGAAATQAAPTGKAPATPAPTATAAADALQSAPVQEALRMVSSLLLGVHLDVALTPPDAPSDQVTHVALSGT